MKKCFNWLRYYSRIIPRFLRTQKSCATRRVNLYDIWQCKTSQRSSSYCKNTTIKRIKPHPFPPLPSSKRCDLRLLLTSTFARSTLFLKCWDQVSSYLTHTHTHTWNCKLSCSPRAHWHTMDTKRSWYLPGFVLNTSIFSEFFCGIGVIYEIPWTNSFKHCRMGISCSQWPFIGWHLP